MPQIARTTTGMWPINVSWLQSRITTLKSKMLAGGDIKAADFNELVSIYNYWILHKHYASDLIGIDDTGNVTKYGTGGSYTTAYSGTSVGDTSSGDTVSAGNDITITQVNNLIAKINGIRAHYHSITDTIS